MLLSKCNPVLVQAWSAGREEDTVTKPSNRQQRRATARQQRRDLHQGLHKMRQEGQGVYSVNCYPAEVLPRLRQFRQNIQRTLAQDITSLNGIDPGEMGLVMNLVGRVKAIDQYIDTISQCANTNPLGCMLCHHLFIGDNQPITFALLEANVEPVPPEGAVVCGLFEMDPDRAPAVSRSGSISLRCQLRSAFSSGIR